VAVKIKLEGFRELERALAEELPKATARNVLNRTAKASLELIPPRMAQLAPFDPLDRDDDGNHLRDTMKIQPAKAKLARNLGTDRKSGVVMLAGPAPVGKRARANAGWQERGTVKMAAHPYARPTADAEGENVIESVRENLAAEIEKAKARIAKRALKGKRNG
jgi:hypothetical protein